MKKILEEENTKSNTTPQKSKERNFTKMIPDDPEGSRVEPAFRAGGVTAPCRTGSEFICSICLTSLGHAVLTQTKFI